MADGEKRIALLIDADNAPASKIDVVPSTDEKPHCGDSLRR
ncbi:MAG: hypothetical protein ACRDTZ_23305 [Pseudonocardiaceae bacterium]